MRRKWGWKLEDFRLHAGKSPRTVPYCLAVLGVLGFLAEDTTVHVVNVMPV